MEKSLLIVTEAFEFGGLESHIRGEVVALQQLGWRVHLACGSRFSAAMLPEGLASLTTDLALGPEASIAEYLDAVDRLVELARNERILAIHAHPFTALLPAVACALTLELPCAVTLHGPASISGGYGEAYDFMLTSLALPFASHVFAVSEEVAQLASPYVESTRLSVLQNAIETVITSTGGRGERWIAVSRLDESKVEGVAGFIRAALEIGIEGVDVCGDGPARQTLETSFSDAMSEGRVRMLGEDPDANTLMGQYAGVAGMGRVALEGLAAGLPVVLVGYEGVKGVLDRHLYKSASHSNLSGRGLPDVAASTLAMQLKAVSPEAIAGLSERVREERAPGCLWAKFVSTLADAPPVRSTIFEGYLHSLRTLHSRSSASAYWSREVMGVLSRLLASPSAQSSRLGQAFAIHSEAFTRTVIDQQAQMIVGKTTVLAQALADLTALLPGEKGGGERQAELVDMLHKLGDAVRLCGDSLRDTLESQMRDERAAKIQLDEITGRMQHYSAGLDQLQHTQQAGLAAIQHVIEQGRESSRNSDEMLAQMLTSIEGSILSRLSNVETSVCLVAAKVGGAVDSVGGLVHASIGGVEATLDNLAASLNAVEASIEAREQASRQLQVMQSRLGALEKELQAVYGSTSWVLTRPMRTLKRLLIDPRGTSRHLRQMASSTSGASISARPAARSRLRQAWNFLRRTLKTGRVDPADKARLRGMFRIGYTSVGGTLGLDVGTPHLFDPEMEDVFVWSVIDWHFRMQRPQHLAAAMAGKGHRVFYISNNFVDSSRPGFAVESLDESQRLFQVNLHVAGAPQIYFDVADPGQVEALRASLASLLEWTGTTRSISLVQHPFWLQPAQSLPNMRLVYDCMDHHGGFEDNSESVLAGERTLVANSDLLIVTSQWLRDEMEYQSANIALIRNATEYEHFCDRPAEVFIDHAERRVIGYYGAIAEWFDVELIRRVAIDHPDHLVLLVGRDTAGVENRLHDLQNVKFIGEVPYKELPYWLYAFDVCLLPFRVIPLTLATNPVKVYEYLSAGKPTVSIDLPEMSQFDGLVRVAGDAAGFSRQVSAALEPSEMGSAAVELRKAFARQQTWAHRAADLDGALAQINEPSVSVIVLCYNNLEFTRACLASLERYSDYPNLEIIAVDNASSDGSQAYLAEWASRGTNRRFIANEANIGFSAGNNVGLRAATGEYLVILNNDTYVTPGWVRGLVRHFRRNPQAGLIGPVTNNIGNEARIEIHYASMEEMIEQSGVHTRRYPGVSFEMSTAAFFCAMISRHAYETVGPMDEDFGVGFFEDDDYCRRLALNGFQVLCAEDVFVHHHLSASFNQLKAEAKQALFEQNRAIYEAKWGPWVPHVYRDRSGH